MDRFPEQGDSERFWKIGRNHVIRFARQLPNVKRYKFRGFLMLTRQLGEEILPRDECFYEKWEVWMEIVSAVTEALRQSRISGRVRARTGSEGPERVVT